MHADICTCFARVPATVYHDTQGYANTGFDLRGCKLMQVAVLALQMDLAKVYTFLQLLQQI